MPDNEAPRETDPVAEYLRDALRRIADLGGAQAVLARAALNEADTMARNLGSHR